MLATIFGNQNIERILLFLFVNEKCYGTQLQTLLQIPLTPIQHALAKLEKGGVLQSHFEGKVRIYQFNSSYPLRWELEELLKKVYTLLPSQEKKQYCFIHKKRLELQEERKRDHQVKKELIRFWKRLIIVKSLSISAKSRKGKETTTKTGKAEILSTSQTPLIITFEEKGYWYSDTTQDANFSNIFRWTLDEKNSLITLEHLRYGVNRPVFLFHLTSTQKNKLSSIDAHLCGDDTYLGNITWSPEQIIFHWRIIGPRKNDELIYHYI
ncbi:MAG: hypothetical protein COT84_06225 [Chlamydiae bacterium CG10_big_fil_rev_8_21_14_0_10_35_9]|nr:MAG: hypothetical protein COT84_06225 [Chlamydiae bacterium CG10_big_fil_rev_8_21_14_0_10_35_9]